MDATLHMEWGGVGWDVDVRCKMYTLWMLRCTWGGVGWGGMLTFAARCTRCGCYVADGVGWGGVGWGGVGWDVDVRCKMYTLWMLRCTWGGVGWGGVGC